MKLAPGDVFDRLTVVEDHNSLRVDVVCSCGTRKTVQRIALRIRDTKSCGCLQRETNHAVLDRARLRHGHAYAGRASKTYMSWACMIQRCTNPNLKCYVDYGARGITVHDSWRDFGVFLSDMGEKPAGTSIDRIDNDGNYEPGNCRWATRKEQNRNRRRGRVIEYQGTKLLLCEWAEKVGLSQSILGARLRNGWPVERALTAPIRKLNTV